jgi:hypothetical protein
MASLAATYHAQERYDEAEKIKVEVLALRRDVLGEKHPDTIESMAELAVTYHAQERYDEAEKIKVEVLALRRNVLGEKHPDTIRSMAELATTYHAQRRCEVLCARLGIWMRAMRGRTTVLFLVGVWCLVLWILWSTTLY